MKWRKGDNGRWKRTIFRPELVFDQVGELAIFLLQQFNKVERLMQVLISIFDKEKSNLISKEILDSTGGENSFHP